MLPSLTAAFIYLSVTAYQGMRLHQRKPLAKRVLALFGVLALTLHGASLYLHLNLGGALNLHLFNAASLIAWGVIAYTLAASARRPVENLLVMLFPLGAVTVLAAQFLPSGTGQPIDAHPGILAHILLSILAYGMLTIAVFQAILLLIQEDHLKKKRSSRITRNFPPLQTMEGLLFSFLAAGWVLLSLSLASGALYVNDMFGQVLVHKTVLSCFAWVVFAVLLWGRHQLGWRGHTAIRFTLAGFCLLMLAYFGSKLVREFILHI